MSMPCVLVFAGLDPGGGAGLAADVLAIAAQGAHALPVATALTVQDNNRVHAVQPVDAGLVVRQAEALTATCRIDAVKIGIPGSRENAAAIAGLLRCLRAARPLLPGRRRCSVRLRSSSRHAPAPAPAPDVVGSTRARRLCLFVRCVRSEAGARARALCPLQVAAAAACVGA